MLFKSTKHQRCVVVRASSRTIVRASGKFTALVRIGAIGSVLQLPIVPRAKLTAERLGEDDLDHSDFWIFMGWLEEDELRS